MRSERPAPTVNLEGPRLKLREWKQTDLELFASMNADPTVMEHFPARLTRKQSAASLQKLQSAITSRGWGLWAVEVDGELAGLTGLNEPSFRAHFTPCVEIGWRFRKEFWGRGYALEAARIAMHFAFDHLSLPEVVSFTASCNARSQKLMRRLGMTHNPNEDFEHPLLPEGHALRRHVLYRIRNFRVA